MNPPNSQVLAFILTLNAAMAAFAQSAGPTSNEGPVRVRINTINVRYRNPDRSHAFPLEELQQITTTYEHRFLSNGDLAELVERLNEKFVYAGYLTSGAILGDQAVTDGSVTVTIIEGGFPNLVVTNNHRLGERYLRRRLEISESRPFRVQDLEMRLQQLHLDPEIQSFKAVLKPGDALGKSELDLEVQETPSMAFGIQFNNYQSPIVGSEAIQGSASLMGLTGLGDQLLVSYGHSNGVSPISASYSLPVTPYGTTLSLDYRENAFVATDPTFRALDINSTSEIFTVGVRQPVLRQTSRIVDSHGTAHLTRELAFGIQAEHERNTSSLLSMPFSFTPGAVDGKYSISVLRLIADFTIWRPAEILAFRSRLNVGLNLLGSTIHNETVPAGSLYPGTRLPDSQFVSWQGQVQWSRRFRFLGIAQTDGVARIDGQLSNHDLLPLEQLSMGGRYSVRGFRENELVDDQGLIESYEFRIPIVQGYRWASRLEVVPFEDFGYGDDKGIPTQGRRSIGSIGVGCRWLTRFGSRFGWSPAFEVYWGALRYNHNPSENGTLQDHGLHFQVSLNGGRIPSGQTEF